MTYIIFRNLGDYKDSKDQSLEACYGMSQDLVVEGRYYQGYELYASLGDYKDSKGQSVEAYRGFLEMDSSTKLRIVGYQWLLDRGYPQEKVFDSFAKVLATTEVEEDRLVGWKWLETKGYAEAKEGIYELGNTFIESGDPYHGYQSLISLGDYKDSQEIVKELATIQVTLDPKGGEIQGGTTSLEVKYNEPYEKLPIPNRDGCQFIGWYTTIKGVETAINSAKQVTIFGNHSLYAKWKSIFSIPMVLVAGGNFQMGNTSGSSNEKPVHMVTVDSFYMGTYEVTQDIYEQVMGGNPSYWEGSRLPVEKVSWYDAVAFCNALSRLDGLQEVYTINGEAVSCDWNKKGYRLPTEAEWEYAARGGNKSQEYMYAGSNTSSDVAWYAENSGIRTHGAGSKKPNELGLYDMSGNVWERCWDWYGPYSASTATNPKGLSSGSGRVIRGGSWNDGAGYMRTATRGGGTPSNHHFRIGFRVSVPAE